MISPSPSERQTLVGLISCFFLYFRTHSNGKNLLSSARFQEYFSHITVRRPSWFFFPLFHVIFVIAVELNSLFVLNFTFFAILSLIQAFFKSLSQPFVSHTNYWTNEEMNSFTGLPPLEMEPLPSLFPFSSCAAATANYAGSRPERPTHDVADVLLSLKNAVLKPNGEPHSCHQNSSVIPPSQSNYGTAASSSASNGALSYTVHHPQILLSPSSHHHYYQCHQNQSQAAYNSPTYYDSSCPGHQHYPSMSVNVSMNMNMTMHASYDGPCSQMQWNPPPPSNSSASSVNVLCPPPFSPAPPYPSATYSFSADFRSPSSENCLTSANNSSHNAVVEEEEEPLLETVKMSSSPLPAITEQKSFLHSSTCFSKPPSVISSLSPNYEV